MERQRVMRLLQFLVDRLVDLKVTGGENVKDGTPYIVATATSASG
jgi:hypothetical protein